MAVVLGLLLAAEYASMASYHYAIKDQSAAQWAKGWRCPPDELEEENVTLAECEAMAARVGAVITARPVWFRHVQIIVASTGVILALLSVITAIGLLNRVRGHPQPSC